MEPIRQQAGSGAAPGEPKKKSNVLLYVLGCGCGCLVMLAGIGGLIWFLATKTHAFD